MHVPVQMAFVVSVRMVTVPDMTRVNSLLNVVIQQVLMTGSNPYSSPKTKSASSGGSPSRPMRRSRFAYYVMSAFVGTVLGGIFLAPYCRCVGDPSGYSVGAGLGGLAALIAGFVLRIVSTLRGAS